MKRIKVYISSPYTLGDKETNIDNAMKAFNELLEMNYAPFAPLLYHYHDLVYPHSYDKWLELCLDWVESCDVLVRLDGVSAGAEAEIELAKKIGIPVYYSIEDFRKNMGENMHMIYCPECQAESKFSQELGIYKCSECGTDFEYQGRYVDSNLVIVREPEMHRS